VVNIYIKSCLRRYRVYQRVALGGVGYIESIQGPTLRGPTLSALSFQFSLSLELKAMIVLVNKARNRSSLLGSSRVKFLSTSDLRVEPIQLWILQRILQEKSTCFLKYSSGMQEKFRS